MGKVETGGGDGSEMGLVTKKKVKKSMTIIMTMTTSASLADFRVKEKSNSNI